VRDHQTFDDQPSSVGQPTALRRAADTGASGTITASSGSGSGWRCPPEQPRP
jgi:hypothetical protein